MGEPTELHLERVHPTVRRLRVRVAEGPDRDRVLEHYGERVGVGTSPANELTLTDPTVSHYHLELRCEDGVLVKDLGSRNGTFVGDVRVNEAVVPIGTRIRVGRTVLVLLDATIAPPDTPLPPPDVPGRGRREPDDAGDRPHRRAAGAVERVGADPGRDGNGQGAGGARHPRPQRARQAAVHRRRSGRAAGDADRVAAVRARARRVHGRREAPGGRVRAGARRHRSFSTRSASCRWRCSRRCSACSSGVPSGGWAARRTSRSTSGSSRPRTATCAPRRTRGRSAPICTSGWRSRASRSRRCANGPRTSIRWWRTSPPRSRARPGSSSPRRR